MDGMEFRDYYAKLGLSKGATPDDIKRAYRKLARRYHPDVSKEPDAEAKFKDVAEAYEVLRDPERRAAYDAVGQQFGGRRPGGAQADGRHPDGPPHGTGPDFSPPPGWNSGYEFSGSAGPEDDVARSEFFEALFGRAAAGMRAGRASMHVAGDDHHARVQIDLLDAYRGGKRTISLQSPVRDAQGGLSLQSRQLEVNIPKGVREGQHLRLRGQGSPGHGAGPAGDLYLEVHFAPHGLFRVDGLDVYVDLAVAPWEAALGASVTVPTPDGSVQLAVPAGSHAGRRLRLRGKGLPATPPGDLYAVLSIALPPAGDPAARSAYQAFADHFSGFDPRAAMARAGKEG